MSTTRHVMKPRPPLRAFGTAAVLAIVGMGFVVAPDVFGWDPIVRAIGIAFLVLGLAVLGLAMVAMRRLRVEIVLDDAGYRVAAPTGTRAAPWTDVVRVTRAERRLIVYGRDGTRTLMTHPRGGAGDLDALGADIARRLDSSRGYGNPPLTVADLPEEADQSFGS